MRTTVRLPPDLLSRAKKKAAAEGRTLTELIAEGLRLVLSPRHRQSGGRPEGSRLPLSRHRGGLRPGIDPVHLRAADEEMADAEAAGKR